MLEELGVQLALQMVLRVAHPVMLEVVVVLVAIRVLAVKAVISLALPM
jgi:hypothetical protein